MKINKTKIIAEIGTSHNGDLNKAFELIDVAKNSGADFAKFQIVYANEILHPKTGFVNLPTGKIDLYNRFKELEKPFDFYKKINDYCKKINIQFLASPFGLKSLKELASLSPSFIKIASPELNHVPLLKKANKLGFPLIISTGVSMLKDIENAVYLTKNIKNRVLLHCVTSYPALETEYNLKILPNLMSIFNLAVGVSDHSLDPILVPVLSVACGASFIEKHICISKNDSGLDDPVALTPSDFKLMVKEVRKAENLSSNEIISSFYKIYGKDKIDAILGTGEKVLASGEKENYGKTNRSIHALTDLKAGDFLCEKNIGILRTEKKLKPGLSPEFYNEILGAKLVSKVKNGEGINWENLIEFTNNKK